MNVLFALYGDFSSNSAIPLAAHARELHRLGHQCAVALPSGVEEAAGQTDPGLRPILYRDALDDPAAVFPDGRPADILHAWTPREGVRRFVTSYLAGNPTPWVIYLEDNEGWIARAALSLRGLREEVLHQHTEEVISLWTPEGMAHPLRYPSFIGLADGAVVIQDKLAVEVPPWVPCATVMPGVDLALFTPRPADPATRTRYGVQAGERVIVYPGGLNDFTRPGLEALCLAVGLINRQGTPCRLLRSGPVPLDFLDRLPLDAAAAVTDLGTLARKDLPELLALADVFVQPGKHDAFEDLRLPGKLPELLATGRPVILPDTNIASLLRDGVDAVLHRTGSPEEIAEKCLALFADSAKAQAIGKGGRRFAETHFDPAAQAALLEQAYRKACEGFDPATAAKVWDDRALETPVQDLLVRKLRIVAKRDGSRPGGMLEAQAGCIEAALERARGLEAGFAVRDGEIGSLKDEVAARGAHIAGLNQAIAETHAQAVALNEALAVSNRTVTALGEAGAHLQGQVAALTATVGQRERHIAALESSLSWRLTRPLRALGRFLARFNGR